MAIVAAFPVSIDVQVESICFTTSRKFICVKLATLTVEWYQPQRH